MSVSIREDRTVTLHPARDSGETTRVTEKTGSLSRWLIRGIVVVVGGALLAVTATLLFGALIPPRDGPQLTHVVQRGELQITITESGELESASNKDIKCLVAGGSTILSIIEDGAEVKKGDELVRLDGSKIDDEISQQKITHEKARSAHIQAEGDLAVAEIAVTEYREGTFRAELQLAQSNIAIAEENLRTAKNQLEYTERMFRKGYIGTLERDAQGFAVEHATLELALKRTDEDVLQRFTKIKTVQELKSKRKADEAKLFSEKAALELEETRLRRLEAQKENCVIRAPQDGMVIYPETYRWSQEPEVKEGAPVREQQTLIQLPDLTQMQLKVNVHESKVELLKPGMRARITIQDQDWQGEVVSIANRAEQSGWWSGSAKEFATIVKIDGQVGLKPGMSAEVEILVERHEDVLILPVAAIVQQQGDFFCWVKAADQIKMRPLVVGVSDDQFIIVEDGVVAGEEVVMNPRAVVEDARQRALEPPKRRDQPSETSDQPKS